MTRASEEETKKKLQLWEQHGHTILLFIISAALAFLGKTLWEANAVQATMLAKIDGLTAQVAKLEGALGAMQANYVSRVEFSVHEQRLQHLEAIREKTR